MGLVWGAGYGADNPPYAKSKPLYTDRTMPDTALTQGVHYARAASGHQSDRYIWRYVKPGQQTLADAIDELDTVRESPIEIF